MKVAIKFRSQKNDPFRTGCHWGKDKMCEKHSDRSHEGRDQISYPKKTLVARIVVGERRKCAKSIAIVRVKVAVKFRSQEK